MPADHFNDSFQAFRKSLGDGTTVGTFSRKFERIIPEMHAAGLGGQYRLAKRTSPTNLKKLRDEVSAVARFVRKYARPDDRISSRLNNGFPDCTVYHKNGLKREIEVTVARGLARFHEMAELNERGETRGFLDLQNDASKAATAAAKTQQPNMYSTDQAIDNTVRAVEIAARRKLGYIAHTLLIEVVPDMYALSRDRWLRLLRERLAGNAIMNALKFSEVYVTGKCGEGDLILRIK